MVWHRQEPIPKPIRAAPRRGGERSRVSLGENRLLTRAALIGMRFWDRFFVAGICGAMILLAGCSSDSAPPRDGGSQPPRRIIAFAPSSVELIAALGAADRLVAVGTFCNSPPQVGRLPKVGGHFDPDLEAILRLQPDLIVLRGANKEVEQLCDARAIRCFHDPTENLGSLCAAIDELGRILDRPDAAKALVARTRGQLQRVAETVAGMPRPRVLFVVARQDPFSLAGILTAGPRTFVHEMIELAGGENVFGGLDMDYPEVSLEAIVAAQPEVIVDAMPEAEPDPAFEGRVRRLWGELGPVPAVRDGRVHVLTDDNLLVPSPRVVEGAAALAALLHPRTTSQASAPSDGPTSLRADDPSPLRSDDPSSRRADDLSLLRSGRSSRQPNGQDGALPIRLAVLASMPSEGGRP